MSDDSFIREVNEELRDDQLKALWRRYGWMFILAAIGVVIATAVWTGSQWYMDRQASASGDRFLAALNLARDGKTEESMNALQALEKDGYGAYPLLAQMRAATLLSEDGKMQEAISAFDAVAEDGDVPDSVRDIARLRAAMLLVDHGTYEEVAKRAEPLTGETNHLRHSAREVLGLAAWKAGQASSAETIFKELAEDSAAPANMRQRARLMSELINGSGGPS